MPRRPFYTGVRYPTKKRERRIVIPQTPERPIRIRRRSLLRQELIQEDPTWFVTHRRGVRRVRVGEDPREQRAVSRDEVRGTLPERIIYKWLTLHKVFFNFQSSLQGGRLELGGIVADFILPDYMYVLNPTGPTHDQFIRGRKDEEQLMILTELGYRVFFIDDDVVYDEYRFEETMRAIFNMGPILGGGASFGVHHARDEERIGELFQWAVRFEVRLAQVSDEVLSTVNAL